MESRLGVIYCTSGQSYSDRQRAYESPAANVHRNSFDCAGDSGDRRARTGKLEAWPDSRNLSRWHSLAGTARLPLGTTNHVRRFSPFVVGQW